MPDLCPHEISQLGGIDEINDDHELPWGHLKKNSNKYKKQLLKDEVGMAVPKNTHTRNVGMTYHTHYTSLRLLFSIINNNYYRTLLIQYVKCRYVFDIDPWVYGIDFPILYVTHI